MTTADTTNPRAAAILVALAPATLLGVFLAHPFLARLPDAEGVAASLQDGTTRWAVVHLLTAVASGLIAVAFAAVHARLHASGQRTASTWGLPFVIFGSAMYAFLPGLELAPMAAVETGGDVAAVQSALQPWFIAVFASSVLTFAVGIAGFARGIRASQVLSPGTTAVVLTALVVMAVARALPLGVAQFHVQGIAAVVALWPLALDLWRQPQSRRAIPTRSPMTAT